MDGVQVLQSAFGGAHMWFQGTATDVSEEEANFVPDGVAHPIGELMAHVLHTEDFMINTAVQGKPTIWEHDGWSSRLGLGLMVEQENLVARGFNCNPATLLQYGEAVFANTDAFLGGLRVDDLDGELDLTNMGMSKFTLGSFLTTMLLGNTYAHTGEISALKGALGRKGYPF